jgi:hypothetical protein
LDLISLFPVFFVTDATSDKYEVVAKKNKNKNKKKIRSGSQTIFIYGGYRLLAVVLAHGYEFSWPPMYFSQTAVQKGIASRRCGLLAAIRASCSGSSICNAGVTLG